ncbi:FAD-dependent oxidoreductase [Streptomyces sporangiiformans]|uniref:FAD-binding domain-containing protein n=1 Tax=Streptomyces sporangiiformans TaxID=2315329 RepID=A0A505DR13_9ACTN|nr:FAD-dependent monooxygenase [Streptomyces sporangiiformans]TPQ23689.1 hypothetical protein FGD71_002910 [Streptomyces sporangiiformans]
MGDCDRKHGVVIGGGVAGLLAALALAEVVDRVTVIDRDHLPDGPAPRPGAPQGHHAHVLLPRGATAIESLAPGTLAALSDAGAPQVGLPSSIVVRSPFGWMARHGPWESLLTCTRGLIEWVLRQRLVAGARTTLLSGTDVISLLGDASRVTGVVYRHRADGTLTSLDASVVVDASGHGSAAPRWLARFGLAVPETVVDSGVAYTTRPYHVPAALAARFPAVYMQLDMRKVSRGGLLLPVEDDRWLVTLFGTRGATPSSGADGYLDFARRLPHPLIAELLALAEPAGPARGFRRTANRRRHYDRMRRLPEGFVVLGDAACTFNPVYGQGVSVAALGALALRDAYATNAGGHTARDAQRAVTRAADTAWQIAAGVDQRNPLTRGARGPRTSRLRDRYLDRLGAIADHDPLVQREVIGVYALTVPPARLLTPAMLLTAARGPAAPPAGQPPLTNAELGALARARAQGTQHRTPASRSAVDVLDHSGGAR